MELFVYKIWNFLPENMILY